MQFDSFLNDIDGYIILTIYFRKTQNESDLPPIISNKKSKNGFFDDLVENKEPNNQTEDNKKPKTKKKSNTDLKKKKERKLQAIEGQFEGMTMPDFSGITLSDNMNFETKVNGNHQTNSDEQ